MLHYFYLPPRLVVTLASNESQSYFRFIVGPFCHFAVLNIFHPSGTAHLFHAIFNFLINLEALYFSDGLDVA